MITGIKGSGVTTQIHRLCEKYKLESFELMREYLDAMDREKRKRRRERELKRGFKPPPPEDELEEGEPWLDPELEEDPDDFDKEEHEKQLMQIILDSTKSLVIDGNWTTLPEDAVTLPLQEILQESRRMPEVVVVLRCKEPTTFNRCLDKGEIQREYERLMEERAAEAAKRRAEDR